MHGCKVGQAHVGTSFCRNAVWSIRCHHCVRYGIWRRFKNSPYFMQPHKPPFGDGPAKFYLDAGDAPARQKKMKKCSSRNGDGRCLMKICRSTSMRRSRAKRFKIYSSPRRINCTIDGLAILHLPGFCAPLGQGDADIPTEPQLFAARASSHQQRWQRT